MTTSADPVRWTARTAVRRTAVALAAVALLSIAACGSDGDTATVPADAGPSGPTADQEFSLQVADLFVAVTRAGADLCGLKFAVPEEPLQAASSAQLTQSVSLRVAWLRAVADALPADSEATAQVLRDTATTLMDDAQSSGFPVDFWSGPVAAATLGAEPYLTALERYSALVTAQCPPDESVVIPTG